MCLLLLAVKLFVAVCVLGSPIAISVNIPQYINSSLSLSIAYHLCIHINGSGFG